MSKFVISKRSNGEYQFNLEAANGKVILTSQGYDSKAGCNTGIASVRVHAPEDKYYDRLRASDGAYYFNLNAVNGRIIGTSQMYESASGCDNGIESVKINAPNATVEDLS